MRKLLLILLGLLGVYILWNFIYTPSVKRIDLTNYQPINEFQASYDALNKEADNVKETTSFKKYDIVSFYINSAIEDLHSLGLQDMHYYHVKGATGCHKDRNVSKTYLAHNYEDILKHIEHYLIFII